MEVLANRYRPLRPIGEGGMGVVYEGVDQVTGRPVAIKRLRNADLADATAVERFRREATATSQLRHPNIIELVDFVPGPSPAIVLELLVGENLRQALGRGMLPLDLTVRVVTEVLAALDAAHRLGLVHRDVKPGNVFLVRTPNGVVTKLLDFGVAKLLEPQGPPLTRSSQVVGSATYMAPEQIRGLAVDARADLFAVGLCAYELLTGRKPYEAGSLHESMLRIMQGEPVPEHPALTPAMLGFLRRATHADPAQRFASALDMQQAFTRALSATGTMQSTFVPSAPKSRAPWIALGVFGLLVVVGAAVGVTWNLARPDTEAASVAVASSASSSASAAPSGVAASTAAVADAGRGQKSATRPGDAGAARVDGGAPAPPSGDAKVCKDESTCAVAEVCRARNDDTMVCLDCARAFPGQKTAYCGTAHRCEELVRSETDCGTCGHQCGKGEQCAQGRCGPIATVGQSCTDSDQCKAGLWCAAGACACPGALKYCPRLQACTSLCPSE